MKVIVKNEFRDISCFKVIHKVGDVLEVEKGRADRLISLGLVETEEEKGEGKKGEDKNPVTITLFDKEFEKKALVDALKTVGAQAAGTMGEKTLLEKVAGLDEETTAKLKTALGIE